jgi:hypothetical protein
VLTRALGLRYVASGRVVFEFVAPLIRWQVAFATQPGDAIADARAQLERAADAFRRQYQNTHETLSRTEKELQGRGPKTDTQYLQQWATWFYHARVQRPPETIAAVAIAAGVSPRLVRHGLAGVTRLLVASPRAARPRRGDAPARSDGDPRSPPGKIKTPTRSP